MGHGGGHVLNETGPLTERDMEGDINETGSHQG